MRRALVIGNWKMHLTLDQATKRAEQIAAGVDSLQGDTDIVLCPPMPWLMPVAHALKDSRIVLGAQDAVPGLEGNETGNVSLGMLRPHIEYVLVGHSERRLVQQESPASINAKILDALKRGLSPVVCVGEFVHLYDRKRSRGRPTKIESASNVFVQLKQALKGVKKEQMSRVVVAYEPVWAIDSGAPADPQYVEVMATALRRGIAKQSTKRIAANTRILYGGSVSAANIAEYAALEAVDGVLVGSASLSAQSFSSIATAFSSRR